MARQEIMIKETIRAMKKAMKRRPSDSDSDDWQHASNKPKRRAAIEQMHLDTSGGLAYKKKITHAGYERLTISKNPLLLDDEGDVYSPTESDYEADPYGEPARVDPFADVQLEQLLRPLTSPAELAGHPSLSIPYKSKALTQMADESLQMLRRKRASLWKAKRLLQRLRGDLDWVNCDTFETYCDRSLLPDSDQASIGGQSTAPSVITDQPILELDVPPMQELQNGTVGTNDALDLVKQASAQEQADEAIGGVEAVDIAVDVDTMNKQVDSGGDRAEHAEVPNTNGGPNSLLADNPPLPSDQSIQNQGPFIQAPHPAVADLTEREGYSETASQSNGGSTYAIITRRRARSPAGRSDRIPSPTSSDSTTIPAVHPWFVPPPSCLADRDLGLPANEADETRKMLFSYVQKHEQIVRSLESLYAGLQKADRLRRHIYRSCKAAGHLVSDGKGNTVTEMSDGEDWYDVADWNMQPWEVLEKGKDEVEDVEEGRGRRPGRGRRVNRM